MDKSIYSPKHQQLADLLRRIRHDAGLTQHEVAHRLGRHHPFVHDYETGQRRLDVVRLQEVAHALGTSLTAIVRELSSSRAGNGPATPANAGACAEARQYEGEWSRLCRQLRWQRKAAGMTEAEVAMRLDEPQSFVSKYETKKRRLDLIELEQIAAALDTTLLALVASFEDGEE